MPNREECDEFVRAVGARHTLLGRERVGLTIDGVHVGIEKSAIEKTQQRFYNGWTHDHHVKNVLVFAPNGKIVIAGFYVPRKCYNSEVVDFCKIYDKLGSLYESFGIKCTADSAFTGRKFDFIIKTGLSCRAATLEEACLMDEATSMRQSAEWGMKLYQAAYPRIKDKIRFPHMVRNYQLLLLTALITN